MVTPLRFYLALTPTVITTAANSTNPGASNAPPHSGGQSGVPPGGTGLKKAAALENPTARKKWKKLTGTAMFINRLGKTEHENHQTSPTALLHIHYFFHICLFLGTAW